MRKMFTRLFGLTLFMYLVSSLGVVQAQDCDIVLDAGDVVLLTDITEKCDSDLIQYAVTGFPDSTYYNFNSFAGDSTAAGFTLDSTIWVTEGTGFTVQVLYNGTCYSQVLTVSGENLIMPVYVDTLLVTQPVCADDMGELTVITGGTESFLVNFVDSADYYAGGPYTEYNGSQFQANPGTEYFVRVIAENGCTSLGWDSITVLDAPDALEIADVNTSIDTLVCVGDSAMVTVEGIAGGTAPYYVTLSDGQMDTLAVAGNDTFYVSMPGTYKATVVDTMGCKIVSDSMAVIAGPDSIMFEISFDDVTCADSATGTIYVHDITGGTSGSFTATLVGADTSMVDVAANNDTVTFDGLLAGYYSVWVKDAACALDSTAYDNPNGTGNVISVQAPGEVELTVVADTSICIDSMSMITASATGGSDSYEFQLDSAGVLTGWGTTSTWMVPDEDADYVVWVRDADAGSCELAWPVITISANTQVKINSIATISPTCPGGNDGVINIDASGDGTLWYSLDSTSWKTNNIFAVFAGNYTVYVRTDNCMNDVDQMDVTVNALDTNIIEIVSIDSIECFDAGDGQIVLSTVKWASQTTEVRDITIYGMMEGDATVDSIMSSGVGTNDTISNLEAGTYYFWAIDEMGCVLDADLDGFADTLTAVITEAGMLTVTGSVTEDATCYGNYDGIMTIKPKDGTPTEYGHANTVQAANNLPAAAFSVWPTGADSVNIQVGEGDYYVVVKDACGAKAYYGPLNVDGLNPVDIADTAMMVMGNDCYGDTIGYIEVAAATGGSEDLVYTLQMMDAGMWVDVDGYVEVESPMFENLPSDTFKVVVSDLVGGCDGDETDPIIVDGPAMPVMISALDSMDISCYGASDGLIRITASGGYGPYEFKVGTTNWRAFPTDSVSKNINVTDAGMYMVWVRDSLGCVSDPMTATIDEPEEIMLMVDGTDVTVGSCSTPDGEIDVMVYGGNTNEFNIYIPGLDTAWNVIDSAETWTNVPAGTYTVIAEEVGGNDCYAMMEVVIGNPDSLEAEAVVLDSVGCYGSGGGEILVQVTGGNPGYVVELDNGMVKDSLMGDSVVFDNLMAGDYTITVFDSDSCYTILGLISISQSDSLMLAATWISNITCDPGYGQFSVQADGGSGDFVYYTHISVVDSGHVLVPDPMTSDDWQADSIFNIDMAGTYIVWAYDTINGCMVGGEELNGSPVNEWRVKIEEPEIMISVNAAVEGNTACYGSIFDITVPADSIMVTQNGSDITDPADYTVMIDTLMNDTLSGVGPGTYVVKVTHVSGCIGTDTVVIAEQEMFTVKLDKGEGEFTCPEVVEGYLEATVVSGGTAPYTYTLWQDGDSLNTYVNNSFLVKTGSEYVVVATDANGCSSMPDTLMLDPVQEINFTIEDVTCHGETAASVRVTIDGEPGRTYKVVWRQYELESDEHFGETEWSTDTVVIISETFKFDNESDDDQHYEIQILDSLGCESIKDSVTFDQVISDMLTVTAVKGDVDGCETDVTITPAGGVAPYTIMVNDSVMTETVVAMTAGMNIVTAIDAHGCMAMDTVDIDYEEVVYDSIAYYAGGSAHYMEYGFDTMLWAGDYEFEFMAEGGTCVSLLMVNVEELPLVVPSVVSVTPTDTIDDNHADIEMVFDGPITFNDSVMGSLYITQLDSTEATLEIPITSDMVSGNTLMVDYDYMVVGSLDLNTTYVVTVDSGVVIGGLTWDGDVAGDLGEDWMFTTGEDYPTGVNPIEPVTLEFKVYPNPFNDFIRIDNAEKLDRAIITNIAGQRVLDIEYPSYEIRTGNLTTGVYVITLISNDEVVKSDRIIKR